MSAPLMPMTMGVALYAQVQSIGAGGDEKLAAIACGNALANVRPMFAGAPVCIDQTPKQIAVAQYVGRLEKMDWQFEHGPHEQWRKGKTELQSLRELQVSLDPDAQLWNCNAPLDFLITRCVKIECDLPAGGYASHWIKSPLNNITLAQIYMERHGIGTKVKVIPQHSALPFEQVPA